MQYPQTPHGRAILACALGDTLGLPYEFTGRVFDLETSALSQTSDITWSDDTQQSLVLLDEYLRFGNLDPHRFMTRLVAYRDYPAEARFGLHRGTGRGFRHSVAYYADFKTFGAMQGRDGNGAAMRVASVAFAMPADERSIEQINAITSSTHDMPNSFHAAEAVVRTVWALRDGTPKGEELALVSSQLPKGQARQILEQLSNTTDWKETITADNPEWGPGQGFSLRSPLSAIYIALHSTSIEDAIRQSIAIGDDTDSTASIAAAIATAMHPLEDVAHELFDFRGRDALLDWDSETGPPDPMHLIDLEIQLR